MPGTARPAEGLFTGPRAVATVADLFANVWQLGYVTSDLDRALAELAQRFGLEHQFRVPSGGATFMAGDEVVPWEARFAMAARGGLIVEVIEPVAGEVGFYRDALPADGSFAIRLHHLAAFMETGDEAWARAGAMLEQAGLCFDYTMLIPGRSAGGLHRRACRARAFPGVVPVGFAGPRVLQHTGAGERLSRGRRGEDVLRVP